MGYNRAVQSEHLDNIQKALFFLAEKFEEEKVPWLLGASGALMVWGVKVIPHDLDIFVSANDVRKLEKVFKDYVINPLHNFEDNNRNYLEFQMKIDNVEIEICELDIRNEELFFVDFQGRKIPVIPLEKELQFYENRSGKKERVRLIKERLKELKNR